ncbi:hypothetical protein RRF57_004737 [Xylaria bambusicola]|uniref:Peptidase S54 rhomboid domain-containing protein n=1 Tax=Xylaria bambusicola TaxID=326684 RepID=A0AAN7UI90_9PEZI
MFRARSIPLRWRVSRSRPPNRSYSMQNGGHLRSLGPIIWSIGACSTIYLSCAFFDVYRDAQRVKARGRVFKSFEELENSGRATVHGMSNIIPGTSNFERSEFSVPDDAYDPYSLTTRVMGLTAAAHISYSTQPTMKTYFEHVPASSRNFTLLTSTFGHAGLLHLGINLYGMFYLMPHASIAPVLKGSDAHLTAFYLSAGIVSGLAHHLSAIWLQRGYLTPSLGASGALFALLGIVGTSFPSTQVGLIFLPGFSMRIDEAMAYIALFDAIGIFVRYPGLQFAHASHLCGLGLGVAYAKFGGDRKIWRPARKLGFKTMRALGLL